MFSRGGSEDKFLLSRREALFGALAAIALPEGQNPELGVEAYIFQQYAQRQHKPLSDILPEAMGMVRRAGFRNIELNREYLTPQLQETTLRLIRQNALRMPSVYSGGPLHESPGAGQTIQQAVRIGKTCKPFDCAAVVFNAQPKGEGIEKTDDELAFQAKALNRLGRALLDEGLQLRVHNHTPEILSRAREWRSTLRNTDPSLVSICLDLDWVHQGGEDPLALLKDAGNRVREIHVRNSHDKLWLEAFEDGDIDYRKIAAYLRSRPSWPYVVVELAYKNETKLTRSLEDDLRRSRIYAESVFTSRS
jgi:inosose dehydratase